MGSSSSRSESRRSPDRFKLSSIFCGGSSSHAPLERECLETVVVNGIENSMNCASGTCPDVSNTSSSSVENHIDQVTNPDSRNHDQVDVSSRSIDQINNDARRNSGHMIRRDGSSSRRNSNHLLDSTTIVFSAGDRNDLESHDRWVLDFAREFFRDEVGSDYRHIGSRLNRLRDRRRDSRSMIWGGHHSDIDGNRRRTSRCSSRLHPEGSCSCDSFSVMMGDSSARANISRIGLLAETLFEVLDEIHRQPVLISQSTGSLPASESVVDSFPLKKHKRKGHKKKDCRDDLFRCYICLADYEERDKIRVLPCHHEYHMSCVDKWLKEIHGVCPLCRANVSSTSRP